LTKNYRVLNYNNHIFQPPVAGQATCVTVHMGNTK
jgi:hypothetical protein